MIFPSQQRKESMALTLAELDKVANPVICEVGRMRNPMAGESDGHSTLVFVRYLMGKGSTTQLISIDVDPATEKTCCGIQGSLHMDDMVNFINEEAIHEFAFLGNGKDSAWRMDLLYLDGWDLADPDSAKKHLTCFMLAEPMIKPGGLVLIDDTGTTDLGKGRLVAPVALLMGWTILHQGYQTLLRKP